MKEPSQRVKDILANMSIEQKAAQLSCVIPSLVLEKGEFKEERALKEMPFGVGRMTQFASGFTQGPVQAATGYNAIQKYMIEKTGLPAIIQNESSSGTVAAQGTIFPVPIALASSFEPKLSYEMGKVIADEGKAIGVHAMMSPVADVSRDARWGRVDETFGEDPLVCARFTSEEVRGIQGEDYTSRCAALAKHWVGYGASEGGINCATINIGKKELFEVYATPFAAAIKENDMQSIMVTYSEIDGRPMSVNEEYTQKVLREDLDAAVLRTLQFREEMGLLDNPYVDPQKAQEVYDDPKADKLSEEIAQKAITLLKNDGILPLKNTYKKIAVIGPFANKLSSFFGGYAYPAMMGSFLEMCVDPSVAVKMEGFQEIAEKMFDIESMKQKMYKDPSKSFAENFDNYLKEELGTQSLTEALQQECKDITFVSYGESLNTENYKACIEKALEVAKDADAVILALGEVTGQGKDATSGEGVNNPDLSLPFHQQELVEAIHSIHKPSVLVLFNGRPLALGETEPLVNAIVEAWYPGPSGGKPVAKVLSGAFNPQGHLPVTFPRMSAQCPIYYGHKTGSGYMNIHQEPDASVMQPLYPFGYGLSYTTFKISNLKHEKEVEIGDSFKVSIDITNTGTIAGSDVVQVYTHSMAPTINRPIKELRGFKNVYLNPKETKTIEFEFDTHQFGYYNALEQFVIENRPQEIFVGDNSSVIQEKGRIEFKGKTKEILHERVFDFKVVEK